MKDSYYTSLLSLVQIANTVLFIAHEKSTSSTLGVFLVDFEGSMKIVLLKFLPLKHLFNCGLLWVFTHIYQHRFFCSCPTRVKAQCGPTLTAFGFKAILGTLVSRASNSH